MLELFKALHEAGILTSAFILGALLVTLGIVGKVQTYIELTTPRAILLTCFGMVLVFFGLLGYLFAVSAPPPVETPEAVGALTTHTNTPTSSDTPTSTPFPTFTPTSTSTSTHTPTPTHTLIPAPTSTPKPKVQCIDVPVSIGPVANKNILELLPEFPVGEQTFEGVKFFIPEHSNSFHTQCEGTFERPTEFVVPLSQVANPESIYVLVNAGYSSGFKDRLIGIVEVYFATDDNQPSLWYNLVLGQNIREWLTGVSRIDSNAVTEVSSPDCKEIYRGSSVSGTAGPGVQDMLKLNIPEGYKTGKLKAIVFRDVTQESWSSANPCLLVSGLTIRVRSEP